MNPSHKIIEALPIRYGKKDAYAELLLELVTLQQELLTLEIDSAEIIEKVDARHRASAANLIHYLGLRRHDVRPLQEKLAAAGLSSMGRAESHVLSNLRAIIVLLQRALGRQPPQMAPSVIDSSIPGSALLETNTNNLLGKSVSPRHVRIMVTLPGSAADDYALVKEMLLQGMDCARINCAHDDEAVWRRLIKQIKRARRETGRRCRILMDLAGPKLRTGQIAPGPAVLKWQPQRDVYGKVTAPARIWIYPEDDPTPCPEPTHAQLPVKGNWLKQVTGQDRIEFSDARGALRSLRLVEQAGTGYWAESTQTSYIKPGLKLYLLRNARGTGYAGEVGALPATTATIRLHRGDTLILTRKAVSGHPARFDKEGHLLQPASIACSLPEIFAAVRPGERILFDDGRIGGLIRDIHADKILVEITQARDGGEKLLADKGINLPDSQLDLEGLTASDIKNLEFIVRHADMVGLSFVRKPADIELLQYHLEGLEAARLGIVIKVETRVAFEGLPELILALLRSPVVGVMIARGDLAVECGYERLAELQEEILWLTEAAHLPVIWATQVLEGLTKTGRPSRAEVSDAAMSERAECVMLNKGPHIIQAIQMLDSILQRMQGHQQKKRALLRRLHW
ncbi:pyruvate kinase [Nitrosovibrio tenuis]|uniref:pyruvate kinase n=1 Tax=Nitrosovibrio tenuis TaxID=1233 RepID=A0A1H7QXA6_9PROT|nr:pyruvate kinase [Nitrosovibrio tenuis]SEL52562.1 pyruvate kinase [Nitrosovibrio tenuis]